jgi:hypothetical protein
MVATHLTLDSDHTSQGPRIVLNNSTTVNFFPKSNTGGGDGSGASYSSLEAIEGGGKDQQRRRQKEGRKNNKRRTDDNNDNNDTVDPTLVSKRTGVTIPHCGSIPFSSPGGRYEDIDAFFGGVRSANGEETSLGSTEQRRQQLKKNKKARKHAQEKDKEERRRRERGDLEGGGEEERRKTAGHFEQRRQQRQHGEFPPSPSHLPSITRHFHFLATHSFSLLLIMSKNNAHEGGSSLVPSHAQAAQLDQLDAPPRHGSADRGLAGTHRAQQGLRHAALHAWLVGVWGQRIH